MPQALLSVINVLGGPLGVGGAFIANAIGIPISGGLIGDLLGIGPKPDKPSDGQQTIRAAVASRKRHYGVVHTGGVLSFYESRDGTLGFVVTTGHGRANRIVEHRINGNQVVVGTGGVLSDSKFRDAIRVLTRLGTDDQTSISELTAIFSEWTVDHRQRGCSHAAIIAEPVKQKYFSEVYEGNRPPEYTQVIEGVLCYDPRKDSTAVIGYDGNNDPVLGSGLHRIDNPNTWQWTDNAALIIGDYWASDDGYGVGAENVNWTNIAHEADISDQIVTTVDTQTIKRWRIWGSYSLAADERKTVLQEMVKACDGYSWQDADGKLNLQVGRWTEPTVHISDDHIVALNGSMGAKAIDRGNEVKIVYTDAKFDYSEQESAPVVDVAAQSSLGRPESQRFDVLYAPHHNQAVRLGKRILTKLSDRWNLVIIANLYGLNLIGERFCRLTCAELEIDNLAFELSSLRPDYEAGTVEIGLSEVRSTDWDFDASLEEGAPPEEPGVVFTDPTVPVPHNLRVSTVQVAIGETNGVGISATWDEPTRAGLSFICEYRPSVGGVWINLIVNQDEYSASTGIITSGVEYQVRVKAVTISGRESDWTAVETITPVADNAESAPSPPSQFSATGTAGEAAIDWRNPTDSNFGYVRVFRSTTNDIGIAVQTGGDIVGGLGTVQSIVDDGLSVGTYYYWLRAYSESDHASGPTTSQSAVVT